MKSRNEIIKKLYDDNHYYGEFGRQFLSKSDIKSLTKDPKSFKNFSGTNKNLIIGRYFHTLLLEPHKIGQYQIVDASTRTTNIYKDALRGSGEEILLLRSETEEAIFMVNSLLNNQRFVEDLNSVGVKYESPGIAEIGGVLWKGKLDIELDIKDYHVDVKSAEDITRFKWDAMSYDYDAQSYIYSEIFGKPLAFWVVDKKTGLTGLFYSSEEFMSYGKAKVEKAIAQYDRFFALEAKENVNEFYLTETL